MRRSAQVAAPLLAAASLSLILGCETPDPCRANPDTPSCASESSPATDRGGFGSSFAFLVLPGIVLAGWWMNKRGIGG